MSINVTTNSLTTDTVTTDTVTADGLATGTVTTERPVAIQARVTVPWLTVVPLAVVMAYGDGFWLTTLRGAVGAIERTQGPFASWLRDSTLLLPVFVLGVLGALTLAFHLFGPVLRRSRTVLATALLVVAAGTIVGIAAVAASSAYDYRLQASQLQLMNLTHHHAGGTILALQQQASHDVQVRAVAYGSVMLLITNLVLVGWVVALRGGRLNVSTPQLRAARTTPQSSDSAHGSRVGDVRLLLAAGLFGSAAIHGAVVPAHLTGWAALADPTSAGVFFIVLAAAQLAVAVMVLKRLQPTVLHAAALVSVGPLALWLYSRAAGVPFGPGAGVTAPVGLADFAAFALEVGTLLAAVVLLRGRGWLRRRPPVSAHVRWLTLGAVIAVTAIGFAGSGLPGFDNFGGSADQSATIAHQHSA